MKNLFRGMLSLIAPPAPNAFTLAVRGLAEARCDLLTAESRLEECQAAVEAYKARITRLQGRIEELTQ